MSDPVRHHQKDAKNRTNHLYAFFIQWSPDMYGEGAGVLGREPGFMVVKRNEESETGEEPASEVTAKDWEVVSVAEYHRRIDALNTEELRSLCKRLKVPPSVVKPILQRLQYIVVFLSGANPTSNGFITTKEDVNSKQGPAIKTDLEPDTFRPNLSEPSELLQPRQIEKLAQHLPPRTIGYPWTLAFSTARNGMSIKTLYRTMQGQDTPVLMVLKDSDGQVFGALASEPFKVSDCFYGTGETFLFTFCPEFELAQHLPPRTIGYPWTLAFSTARNGMSIKTLYRTMQGQDTPVLMVLKDSDGQVFGALASEPFKVSDCFYGTGETFLFTFCPEFEPIACYILLRPCAPHEASS
ncbi:UNVERIFIED_CONTAM: hypothetical protein FKN15_045214 [Acipenser sinensis]